MNDILNRSGVCVIANMFMNKIATQKERVYAYANEKNLSLLDEHCGMKLHECYYFTARAERAILFFLAERDTYMFGEHHELRGDVSMFFVCGLQF
jgi:hypothetical protein